MFCALFYLYSRRLVSGLVLSSSIVRSILFYLCGQSSTTMINKTSIESNSRRHLVFKQIEYFNVNLIANSGIKLIVRITWSFPKNVLYVTVWVTELHKCCMNSNNFIIWNTAIFVTYRMSWWSIYQFITLNSSLARNIIWFCDIL